VRLLVSVRSGAEVAAAVAGGADLVDAKEPARGSLGAVDPAVLAEIAGALPSTAPLSVALGDLRDEEELERAMAGLPLPGKVRPRYLKLGFARVERGATVRAILASAVARARALEGAPGIIAVAYADHERAGSISPALVAALAADSGATGSLLDTWTKDGRDLFAWISPAALRTWVARTRRDGLLVAVAGSLRPEAMLPVVRASPDIVGVRGAVCQGGRSGIVTAAKVRAMRTALDVALGKRGGREIPVGAGAYGGKTP